MISLKMGRYSLQKEPGTKHEIILKTYYFMNGYCTLNKKIVKGYQ